MKIGYVIATPEVATPLMPAVQGAFERNLAHLKGLGYDGVELAMRDPSAFDSGAVREVIEETGLEVSLIATAAIGYQDGLKLCHPDAGVRDEAMKRLKALVEFAAGLGCPVNIGGFRGKLLEGERGAESEGWMWGALREGADYAADKGTRILFEPHHRFSTNFVRSTAEGLRFLEDMNHPAVGLLIDTFHMNIEDASFAESIRAAAEKINYVHIADNHRGYPGSGHIPFGEVVGALKEVGYQGYLSAQLNQKPDFETASRETIACLRALM